MTKAETITGKLKVTAARDFKPKCDKAQPQAKGAQEMSFQSHFLPFNT